MKKRKVCYKGIFPVNVIDVLVESVALSFHRTATVYQDVAVTKCPVGVSVVALPITKINLNEQEV